MSRLASLTVLTLLTSCGQTGGAFVDVPFAGQGTEATAFVKDGWEVALSEATVGFGSIFFCATESSSPDRCEVAILEFREGVTLDGLDASIQPIGELFGTTGTINTAFFNYGVVWLLTEPLPTALDGAPGGPAPLNFESPSYSPGGHSGRFEGTATCIEGPEVCCPEAETCPESYRFEAFVDLIPGVRGEPTINGLGTRVTIDSAPVRLTVRFDPTAWWQIVDYGRLASLDDGSGTVVLGPEDPDYSAVVIAMSGNPPPTFTWSTDHEMKRTQGKGDSETCEN